MQTVVVLMYVAGIALSVKSIVVLGRHAPWTSAGWFLTIAYFVVLLAQSALRVTLAGYGEYVVLVVLAIAFIVAGVRDEPQAEVWWWPTHRGATRAQKRLARLG